jgi:alpha-glucosidase
MRGARYAAPEGLRGWKEAAGRGGRGHGTLLELDLGAATAQVGIGADGTLRLRSALHGKASPWPEDALERGPWEPVQAVARKRGGGRLSLSSADATVSLEIEAEPFSIRLLDRGQNTICRLTGLCFTETGASRIVLEVAPEERFFGFGDQVGPLDKRGCNLTLRNEDAAGRHISVPYFLVHRTDHEGPGCYGALADSFATCRFDIAASDPAQLAIEVDSALDLMLFPGPTPTDVTRRFSERVGRTPLPPIWALGHHLSRRSYASESEVRAIARALMDHDLPTDAIHLDAHHKDGFRSFSWHPRRFPDPAGLLHSLTSQGLHVVSVTHPGVETDPASTTFASGSAHDVFCRRRDGSLFTLRLWPGECALPDFNRSDVRHWWGRLHEPLVEAGVAGIWNDLNEPSGWRRELRVGRRVLPLQREGVRDFEQAAPTEPDHKVAHEEVHNLFAHQQNRATREALETLGRERRPFVLTRAAFAGTQRYAAVTTAGSRSRWEDLRNVLPTLLSLGLSGMPFSGSDIGGFRGSTTAELYARWMQIGALSPLARTHSDRFGRRQEPWRFGKETLAIARDALQLRMRLLPYLYGLFRHSEESGAPVWRSLAYEFPNDANACDIDDQVMIGPSLLAAPVLERSERKREVYLPAGDWIDWHDGARFVGARLVCVDAGLERLPLFARGGSVLPTRSPVRNNLAIPEEPLVLEVFPGADASLELIEDDGETVAYQGDVIARTPIRLWTRAGGRLRLELGRREGPFAIAPRPLRICVNACPTPNAVYLDGARLLESANAPGWQHDDDGRLHIRLHDLGAGCSLELDPAP